MAKTPQPSRAAQTRQPATPSVDAALRDIVAGYKRRVAGAYRPVTIDDVGSIPPGALLVSRKLDGELWCLFAGPAGPQLINPRGRAVVEGSPILAAAAACLPAGVVLAGELHGPFEGRRERVGDVATALASGDPALCFTAFDVVQDADGAEPADGYEARLAQLDRWLGTATGTLRRVSTERLPDVTALRAHYQTIVVDGGAEGLVVRASNGLIYKLKPVIDLDAVVVGFTEKAAEPGHVRSLLLGLRHEDGRVHVLGGCGTLGTLDDRRILFEQLTGLRCPSTVRQASDGGGLYTFVEPRVVVTIHVTDLQAERSDGAPTLAPLLSFDARGWHGHGLAPCPRPLHPVFDRVRPDKDGSGLDVRVAQVGPWLSSAPAQVAVALPVSTLVRRAVWTKTTKGQTAVRKLVVWKTNKADQDATFPAYVVHWTDYSAGRATPLDREVRVAPTETEALRLAEALVAEHIKKGWEPVGA